MRIITDRIKIVAGCGELTIENDDEQECIHVWFIPTNAEVEVDCNHIMIKHPPKEAADVVKYIVRNWLNDIRMGLEGELEYKDSPFFEAIDTIYKEYEPKGCYFCDRGIDGNAEPFDYPENTKICMTCMLKAANLLKAFGIDPQCLFPGIAERKIQPVLFEEKLRLLKPSGN